MEQQLEVMRRVLELSDTCIEGLEYIRVRLHQGYLEDYLYLVEDIVYGFSKIYYAIEVLSFIPETEKIVDSTLEVEGALSKLIHAYEQQDINGVKYRLSHELLPAFRLWKHTLYLCFHHHILS